MLQIIIALVTLLGSNDYTTRQLAYNILNNMNLSEDSIKIIEEQGISNSDLEIKTSCKNLVHTWKTKQYNRMISIYLILPQLDMLEYVGHGEIFSTYRTQAIANNEQSYWPMYMACRTATHDYFLNLYLNKQISLKDIHQVFWTMYIREIKWYLWLKCDWFSDEFLSWEKPSF